MPEIELYFSSLSKPELIEVVFRRDDKGAFLHSLRGRVSGTTETQRTFLWSPAVKALSVLLISAKLTRGYNSEVQPGSLRGQRGSLASSLDYAISKQPEWILDMFGTVSTGVSYSRRLILRLNSECKHAGPVILTIDKRLLPPDQIQIFVESRLIEAKDISELIQQIIEQKTAAKIGYSLLDRVSSADEEVTSQAA